MDSLDRLSLQLILGARKLLFRCAQLAFLSRVVEIRGCLLALWTFFPALVQRRVKGFLFDEFLLCDAVLSLLR